jgi:S-DNA-T family DNA segregation ATPase FtsK/SpoIIIE
MAKKRRKKTKKRKGKPSGLLGILPDIDLGIHLDLDQWLDILGYGLLATAALTLLSILSANHGTIPGWWLRVLRGLFGWGAYLLPLLVGATGLWLVLRQFGDKLPDVRPLQFVGGLIGYLLLLLSLHLLASLFMQRGDLLAIAQAGHGGGRLGAAVGLVLLRGLGAGGTLVALAVAWLIIVAITLRISVKDIVQTLEGGLRGRTWPWRRGSLSETGEPPAPQPKKGAEPTKPPLETELPVIAQVSASDAEIHLQVIGSEKEHRLPPWDEILEASDEHDISAVILREQARIIEETMDSLGAPVRVREINHGPVVTQFGLEPLVIDKGGQERRVAVNQVTSRADDLALALEAKTVRFQTPIPGKKLIGLEVPNPESALVAMRDVIETEEFAAIPSTLRLCLGQDVSGRPAVADLAKMPHLLIAGATGSGKSVCLNSIIAALLLQNTPDQLRFLMVDPKRVELTGYNGIPHLLADVVVDMERVTNVLDWVLAEMDGRYRLFSETRASHIDDYNEVVAPRLEEKPLPYIVVIVDELADLMMVAPHQVERSICRIAQMARATGIHMVVATQRPSVDVVTGLIKANFPARIAFNVASSIDSRVILDMAGAEQLLSRGDMLFLPPDSPTPVRLQGTYVSDRELRALVHHWKEEAMPQAVEPGKVIQKPLWNEVGADDQPRIEYEDELLPDVVELLLEENRASISLMQRRLRIGYTRAARIMDILERNAVVGPQPSGGRARDVFPRAARALLGLDQDGRALEEDTQAPR